VRGHDAVANVSPRRRQEVIEFEANRHPADKFAVRLRNELHRAHLILREVRAAALVVEGSQEIRPRHGVVPSEEKVKVIGEKRRVGAERRGLIAVTVGTKT
jgi:hypothetical protein